MRSQILWPSCFNTDVLCLTSLLLGYLSYPLSFCSNADVFHSWRFSCWFLHPIPFVNSVLMLTSSVDADVQTLLFPVIMIHVSMLYVHCSGSCPPSYCLISDFTQIDVFLHSFPFQCWRPFSPTHPIPFVISVIMLTSFILDVSPAGFPIPFPSSTLF